jgi:anti-sigma-K factor RskA
METDAVHELTAAYALDALDEAEEREYEAHLALCERCRGELAAFTEAAAALAYGAQAPEPPAGLRERILEQARAERPNVVPMRSRGVWIAAAAAAIAACVAIGLGIWAASLSHSLSRERSARAREAQALAIVAQPDAQRLALVGRPGVVAVTPGGEAALVVRRLDSAPAGKTYEAWVIEGGKPRRAGLFPGGGSVAVRLERPVGRGTIVAVTVERKGGVDAPTGAPLFHSQPA